jgi:Xaa-Pro aminopeptidase
MGNSKIARENLAKQIKNGAVILHSGSIVYRNNDTWYPFRQDSNFYYLTEWPEPDAHAVILIKDSKPELHLFVQDRNEEMETWEGKRLGQSGAVDDYEALKAYSFQDYEKILPNLLRGFNDIYCDYSSNNFEKYDKKVLTHAVPYDQRGTDFSNATLYSLQPLISELRLIKSDGEIELLTKACDITVEGHIHAMKTANAGMYEYQVGAEMERIFYDRGAERLGYPSIVAGGHNACILHYSTNRDQLDEGSLLLIDAAAEYGMYSSDVTRTFPVSGKFTSPQKDVYEEVLKVQNEGIEGVVVGNSMKEVHQQTIKTLSESLVNLKLVPLGVEETISMMHFFEFFMHGTGHWLGLDVHDAGSNEVNGQPRAFEHGMVTTIEPGIYVRPTKPVIEFPLLERDPNEIRERRKIMGMEKATKLEKEEMMNAKTVKHEIPKDLLGIGVRIEDDIVCTNNGPMNLTENAPKTIEEIEAVTA